MKLITQISILLLLPIVAPGCTHRHLTRSTVNTASTVMEIQYRMVLSNLAMMSCHPEALPSHIEIDDGVIQVTDDLGFGNAGGFTSLGTFGIDRFGPQGTRRRSEQWGADATLDPQRLTDLQDLYRTALGIMPLPPSNSVAYLRDLQKQDRLRSGQREEVAPDEAEDDPVLRRQVPIELLLSDVPPPGWFHLGSKMDVPKNACYVGRYGHRYAWVTANGVPELSRFTITMLSVLKLKPGEPRRRGLMVTR